MTDRPRTRDWFGPRLLGLHLFAIAAIGFCLFMATWQLGVYDQRQAAEREAAGDTVVEPLDEVWAVGEPFTTDQDRRAVRVTGAFRPADEQFWVTGQAGADGAEGVWLVAPLTTSDAQLLVVRGWAPRVLSRVPDVPVGEIAFDAVLQPGDAAAEGWEGAARTIGSVRIPTLLNELGYDRLWSGYAVATDADVVGELAPAVLPEAEVAWTAGGRNLGYGLQWWVFAGFVLFMWWRMARELVLGRDR